MNSKTFRRNYERYTNHINFLESRIEKLQQHISDEEDSKIIEDYYEQLHKYARLRIILTKTYQINHRIGEMTF